MSRTKYGYGFCLTINNPEFDNIVHSTLLKENSGANPIYFVSGIEKGEINGTRHLQVCIYFSHPKSWGYVRTLFPKAHVEFMKERLYRAAFYCMKENNFEQWGDLTRAINLDIIRFKEKAEFSFPTPPPEVLGAKRMTPLKEESYQKELYSSRDTRYD